MAGNAPGKGKRGGAGGARPGAGRPKGSKNKTPVVRIAQIRERVQERRGGARKGSGRKKLNLDEIEMQTYSNAVKTLEHEKGVGVIEQALSLLYDPKVAATAKAAIFKIHVDALARMPSSEGGEENETQNYSAPVIGLPQVKRG